MARFVDVDPAGIEEIDQRLTPTPLTAGTVGVAVADGRVADQEEGRKFRICRRFEANLRVSAGVSGGTLHGEGLGRILREEFCDRKEDEGEE
jgi:hypothetical protein